MDDDEDSVFDDADFPGSGEVDDPMLIDSETVCVQIRSRNA